MKENQSIGYNDYDKFCCPKCERKMCCEKEDHICGKESQEVNYFCGENDIHQLPTLSNQKK